MASASVNIYEEATLIALDMGDEVQLYHTLVYALIWHHKWCVATLLGELHLSGHGLDLRANLIAGGSRVPPRHLPRPERAQLPRLAGRRCGCARAAGRLRRAAGACACCGWSQTLTPGAISAFLAASARPSVFAWRQRVLGGARAVARSDGGMRHVCAAARWRCRVTLCACPTRLGRCMCLVYV